MFILQAGRFRVALHSRQDWYNITIGNRVLLFVIHPPFVEGPVWLYVEPLFRWRSFRKSITNISTVHNKVLRRGNCIEQARAGLVNAIGISFIKDLGRSQTTGTITDASCLFATIKCLDVVPTDEMKDGVVFLHCDGVTKHCLFVILV
jgi:hypothetical protein